MSKKGRFGAQATIFILRDLGVLGGHSIPRAAARLKTYRHKPYKRSPDSVSAKLFGKAHLDEALIGDIFAIGLLLDATQQGHRHS